MLTPETGICDWLKKALLICCYRNKAFPPSHLTVRCFVSEAKGSFIASWRLFTLQPAHPYICPRKCVRHVSVKVNVGIIWNEWESSREGGQAVHCNIPVPPKWIFTWPLSDPTSGGVCLCRCVTPHVSGVVVRSGAFTYRQWGLWKPYAEVSACVYVAPQDTRRE